MLHQVRMEEVVIARNVEERMALKPTFHGRDLISKPLKFEGHFLRLVAAHNVMAVGEEISSMHHHVKPSVQTWKATMGIANVHDSHFEIPCRCIRNTFNLHCNLNENEVEV